MEVGVGIGGWNLWNSLTPFFLLNLCCVLSNIVMQDAVITCHGLKTRLSYPTLPYPAACTDIAATAFRRTKTEISSISGIVKFTAKRVQFKFAKVLVHLERFFFKFIHVSYRYSCTSVYKCVAICSNPSCARWCLIFLHRTVPREQNLLKTHLTPLYCRFFSP